VKEGVKSFQQQQHAKKQQNQPNPQQSARAAQVHKVVNSVQLKSKSARQAALGAARGLEVWADSMISSLRRDFRSDRFPFFFPFGCSALRQPLEPGQILRSNLGWAQRQTSSHGWKERNFLFL
jgi:hypothetical protein